MSSFSVADSLAALRGEALSLLSGQGSKDKLVLIMGNEASDLDSIVCAIVLALGVSTGTLDANLKLEPGSYVVAPVMNIPSSELALRQDAVFLMQKHGIPASNLLFFPELPETGLRAWMEKGGLHLILVDHNALGVEQQWLEAAVCGIVDHHEDSSAHTDAPLRVVDPTAGSCASIVADVLLQAKEEEERAGGGGGGGGGSKSVMDQEAVRGLVCGPLLLDTQLFKGKAAALDKRIGEALQLRLPNGHVTDAAETLYKSLLQSRIDVSQLDSSQRLRKDYKRWGEGAGAYGISTVPCELGEWLKHDSELESALAAHATKEGVALLLVMTTFQDDSDVFSRQLLVFSADETLQNKCVDFLFTESFPSFLQVGVEASLKLEPLALPPAALSPSWTGRVHALKQLNTRASRKQVQPAVEAFMSTCQP